MLIPALIATYIIILFLVWGIFWVWTAPKDSTEGDLGQSFLAGVFWPALIPVCLGIAIGAVIRGDD